MMLFHTFAIMYLKDIEKKPSEEEKLSMQNSRWLMDRYSIQSNEIKSWECFEYALSKENRLLLTRCLMNAEKRKI